MAERRMFSNSVTSSGRFLTQPQTSGLLYFQLGMKADDEGYVDALPVLRMTNCSEQDLRVLAANGFIEIANDLICHITDWEENNWIRPDRLRKSVIKGKIVRKEQLSLPMSDSCQTQDRVGEDRVGKDNIPCEPTVAVKDELNPIIDSFKGVNPSYERIFANKTQRAALSRLVKKFGAEKVKNLVEALPSVVSQPFAPKITNPLELERDLGKLRIFIEQSKNKGQVKNLQKFSFHDEKLEVQS